MFCPKCKVEYRPGFTRCSDCEADLVDVSASRRGLVFRRSVNVALGMRQPGPCVGVCEDLRSANIHYHVDEIPYEKTARMGVEWHYRILTSANDINRAEELLSIDSPQNTIPSSDADQEEVI